MLVTTNDAFFGLDTFNIVGGSRVRETTAPAYDAGSEVNNELCSHIPGPPCENPLVRETDGARASSTSTLGSTASATWSQPADPAFRPAAYPPARRLVVGELRRYGLEIGRTRNRNGGRF